MAGAQASPGQVRGLPGPSGASVPAPGSQGKDHKPPALAQGCMGACMFSVPRPALGGPRPDRDAVLHDANLDSSTRPCEGPVIGPSAQVWRLRPRVTTSSTQVHTVAKWQRQASSQGVRPGCLLLREALWLRVWLSARAPHRQMLLSCHCVDDDGSLIRQQVLSVPRKTCDNAEGGAHLGSRIWFPRQFQGIHGSFQHDSGLGVSFAPHWRSWDLGARHQGGCLGPQAGGLRAHPRAVPHSSWLWGVRGARASPSPKGCQGGPQEFAF